VQERTENTLELKGISNDFLSRTQVAQQLREKNRQMGLHEIKILCTTKEMVIKLKKLPTKWKKIFASYICDKGLTKIYRELKKLNLQKKKKNQ
jgi:peptidyl-tRNA hydrolase